MSHRSILLLILTAAAQAGFAAENNLPIRLTGAQITAGEEIEVPSREIGVLKEIQVRHGQKVKSGEVLGLLDDTEARLSASEAEFEYGKAKEAADSDVEVRAARKAHEVAEAELKRSLEAVDRFAKSISRTEIDRLRLTLERTALAIEQAELLRRTNALESSLRKARFDRAQHIIERHQLQSPVTGVVVQIDRERGEWVEPGAAVFRVLRMDRLRCEVRTSASLVNMSMQGNPVRVIVKFPGRDSVVVPGQLVFVDPRVSPIQKDTLVWAEFDNPGLVLQPGLEAELEILPSPKLAETARTPVGAGAEIGKPPAP